MQRHDTHLWQQFLEVQHMVVMIRYPQTFGYTLNTSLLTFVEGNHLPQASAYPSAQSDANTVYFRLL